MPKGFMPQGIFDLGAVTIAWINMAAGSPLEQMAESLAESYRRLYPEEGLVGEWISAASKIDSVLETFFPGIGKKEKAAILRQLQYCVKEFNPDGTKRKKNFFRKTKYIDEKERNQKRVGQFLINLICYHLRIQNGSLPFMPPKWTL